MEGNIIAKNYRLTKKIGHGAFGEIWSAKNMKNKEDVAIKFESLKSKHQQLFSECKIYLWLHKESSILGQAIPNILYFGVEGANNILIMDLLDSSLEEEFVKCNRKLSIKTTLMVADQMLRRIEYIHSRGIIHRDMKPENFGTGKGKMSHRIYIFDFGLAKKYRAHVRTHILVLKRRHDCAEGD